jgi:indole-3-glycerol phosphate synthase
MEKKPIIIAEVKTKSPFGFQSNKSWEELFAVAEKVGDMISIHTDPRWGGSFDLIAKARRLTKKPILAKGIHENDSDIEKAIESGADFVLVVGRITEVHADKCIIEPYTLDELSKIPETFKALWNSRDLKTGGRKKETFSEVREIFKGWLCQASHIQTIEDIHPLADAVLVGENLENFAESLR